MLSDEQQEAINEDVLKSKGEIKSLKRQVKKLNEASEELKLLDFQSQISHLDERVTSTSKDFHDKMSEYEHELLGLQQYVSAVKINEHSDAFQELIDDSKLRNKSNLKTQLIADAVKTKSDIFISNHPANIAVDFYQRWAKYLSNVGVDILSI